MPKPDRTALDKTAHQSAYIDLSTRIDPLLCRPDVLRITGLRRSALDRLMRANEFPSPVSITEATNGWRQSEIVGWINKRSRVTGGAL